MGKDTTIPENDFCKILPRFTPKAMERNQALIDLLKRIAAEKSETSAQIALAWLLSQRSWIVPISGTTKLHRLKENLGAVAVTLTSADLVDICNALAEIDIEGERCPAHLLARTGLRGANGCFDAAATMVRSGSKLPRWRRVAMGRA